jgi:periplasmic binding family protein
MRSKNLLVAASVAAALAGASSAHALNVTVTSAIPADHTLVVAGASAQRNAVEAIFADTRVCVAGTVTRFRASTTDSPDLRAYSCTLATATPYFNDSVEGDNVVVYYRSEGGSVWGFGGIVKNVPVGRLLVNASCTLTDGANYICPVSNYSLTSDTGGGNFTKTAVQLGVADLEPTMFVGANWPEAGTALGNEPSAAALAALPAVPLFGQAFGVIVKQNFPVNSLTIQDLTSIFTGSYGDWSQVPNSGTSGPITICRRERGSGTQTGADVFFNGTNCSPASLPFVHSTDNPPIFGNTVIELSTSTALTNCVISAANPNTIGIAVANAAPSGTKFVTIEGANPGKTDAAIGKYDYWFESTATKASGLVATVGFLADGLTAALQDDASVPNVPSAFALAGLGPIAAPNVATLDAATSLRPVALARRGSATGSSCSKPQAQN